MQSTLISSSVRKKNVNMGRPFNDCAKFLIRYCGFLRLIGVSPSGDISHFGFKTAILLYHCVFTFAGFSLHCVQFSTVIFTADIPVFILFRNASIRARFQCHSKVIVEYVIFVAPFFNYLTKLSSITIASRDVLTLIEGWNKDFWHPRDKNESM